MTNMVKDWRSFRLYTSYVDDSFKNNYNALENVFWFHLQTQVTPVFTTALFILDCLYLNNTGILWTSRKM